MSDILKQVIREQQTEQRLRNLDMADIVQEVHGLEDRCEAVEARILPELKSENARLKSELAAERERVESLRISHASILAQRPDREICYEIARKALADTQEA